MKEKVKNLLLKALEKELEVEGDEVRPYFIDTLVDCLSRLDDERAPQVEAEEQTELTSDENHKLSERVIQLEKEIIYLASRL